MFEQLLRKIVKFLDPKLDKYRDKLPPAPKYTPHSLEEFIELLKRTPRNILSNDDRSRIAAIMTFKNRSIDKLMIPKKDIVFVNEKDFLGPLMLDKLYKSGFTVFPVVDSRDRIKGIIRTEALNALEIKKTDRAEKYLDPNVHRLHPTDSLETLISEIKSTGSSFFLVENDSSELVGFITINLLLDYLLG